MFVLDIMRRALRSLLSSRARTLLTAFAIAVGAFALTLTLSASNGANNYANTIIKDNFNPSELIVSSSQELFSASDSSKPKEYSQNATNILSPGGNAAQIESLDDSDIAAIKNIEGVEAVRTDSTLGIAYATRDGQRKYGATVQVYSSYKSPELLAGSIGTGLNNDAAILPEGFISSLGFSSPQDAIGEKIRLAVQQKPDQSKALAALLSGDNATVLSSLGSQNEITEQEFTVIAVAKKPSVLVQPGVELNITLSQVAVANLSDISTRGTDNYHKYLTAYVTVADGNNPSKLAAVQSKIKDLGYGAQSVADTQKTITQVITVLQGIVLVFGLIAVIASVFGVVNTMYISVLQRTREIGLMKALGMHKRAISLLFLIEAGLLGLLGGVIGVLVAVVAGTALNPTISKLLNIGDARMLDFHISQIIMLLVVLTIIAMVAGLLPARKASQLDPIEALRTE